MSAEWEDGEALRRLERLQDDEWWVEFRVPYAGYREFGTGPAVGHGRYMPPRDPIYLWVHDRLGLRGKEAERATAAIRMKIYRQGQQAKPFARPATAEAASRVGELVGQELSLQPVAEYIAQRAREIIDAEQTDSGQLASEIYVIHRRP
ncbi:MAG TPA: hypothetical protein DD420_15605 [Streptomyces sp.]|nr:hypothetical protein [Streptomyces sp.]